MSIISMKEVMQNYQSYLNRDISIRGYLTEVWGSSNITYRYFLTSRNNPNPSESDILINLEDRIIHTTLPLGYTGYMRDVLYPDIYEELPPSYQISHDPNASQIEIMITGKLQKCNNKPFKLLLSEIKQIVYMVYHQPKIQKLLGREKYTEVATLDVYSEQMKSLQVHRQLVLEFASLVDAVELPEDKEFKHLVGQYVKVKGIFNKFPYTKSHVPSGFLFQPIIIYSGVKEVNGIGIDSGEIVFQTVTDVMLRQKRLKHPFGEVIGRLEPIDNKSIFSSHIKYVLQDIRRWVEISEVDLETKEYVKYPFCEDSCLS